MTQPVINLTELQLLTNRLEHAHKQLALAQRYESSMAGKSGTEVQISITLRPSRRGETEYLCFDLTKPQESDPYGAAQVVPANADLHGLLQRHALNHRLVWSSAVEGLEFQIRRLVKGGAL